MLELIPDIINFITLLILAIVVKRQTNFIIKKTKEAHLKLTLPLIIKMFETIDLKDALLKKDEYDLHSFNYELVNYLETKSIESLHKMFNLIKLQHKHIYNKFGIVLGCFLTAILKNCSTLDKNYELTNMSFYEADKMEEKIKTKPMLNYYYMWFKTETYFKALNEPFFAVYSFDTIFSHEVHEMINPIWNTLDNNCIIDTKFEEYGIKFGKYLVFLFNKEIPSYEFKELVRRRNAQVNKDFQLLYVGGNYQEELNYEIFDEKQEFMSKNEGYLYNFVVYKYVNYKPFLKNN